MSAFSVLAAQCDRRGWRLALTGCYPMTRKDPGLILDRLEVRGRNSYGGRESLAVVEFDPLNPDAAAVDAARVLDAKGLIA